MSNRLNKEREERLQPKRMEVGKLALEKLGFIVDEVDNTKLIFQYMGHQVTFYPYSGWHTGKSIVDGRGLQHLLNQLK